MQQPESRQQTPLAALVAAVLVRIDGLVCKLQAAQPAAMDEMAVLLRQLCCLQGFPGFVGPQAAASPSSAAARNSLAPDLQQDCTQLLRWQYTLELWCAGQQPGFGQQCRAPVLAALQKPLQQALAAVVRHCREADWTLAGYCASPVAAALQKLQLLPCFSGDLRTQHWLQQHSAKLLDFHLAGQAPAAAALQQWVQALQRQQQQGLPQGAGLEAAQISTADAFQQSTSAELLHWHTLLLQALQACAAGQATGAETLQRVLYKPGWVLLALGLLEPARVFRCAWQILAQYRHLGRSLPPELLALLQQLGTLLNPAAPVPLPATLQRWQSQLLRLWPAGLRDDSLDIMLALPDTPGPRLVTLAAVPDLLSASFNTLADIEQDWFLPQLLEAQGTALQAELALLEKGAAALQVWPLEQLCTLLLEVYAAIHEAGHVAPGVLLWQAHQHLLRMLDQAAAWQEPQRDDCLLQQLQAWLASAGQAQRVCESAPGNLQVLQARLRNWLSNLAGVVEKPVRLQVSGSGAVPGELVCSQVEAGLKPLLKFLLLDNAADLASRRAVHRPRISTFEIGLTVCGQALQVEVGEDSQAPMLEAKRLQQLQRALPATAGTLQCEMVRGMGRRLRFTLPAG